MAAGDDSEDALCLEIGRAARAHVELDGMVRNIFHWLDVSGVVVRNEKGKPKGLTISTRANIETCRAMLAKSVAPTDVKEAGDVAFDAAVEVNTRRNGVVHDYWVKQYDPVSYEGRWARTRPVRAGHGISLKVQPGDIEYVRATIRHLRFVLERLMALNMLLVSTLPHADLHAPEDFTTMRPLWIKHTLGYFEMFDNGGTRAFDDDEIAHLI